jgi:hypothetical protein
MNSADCRIFRISADASLREQRVLRKELFCSLRPGALPVIVDLSSLTGLNHDDIDLLLDCAALASGRDVRLLLVAGSRSNRVLLEITRLSSVLPVFNLLADALDSIGRAKTFPAENAFVSDPARPRSA